MDSEYSSTSGDTLSTYLSDNESDSHSQSDADLSDTESFTGLQSRSRVHLSPNLQPLLLTRRTDTPAMPRHFDDIDDFSEVLQNLGSHLLNVFDDLLFTHGRQGDFLRRLSSMSEDTSPQNTPVRSRSASVSSDPGSRRLVRRRASSDFYEDKATKLLGENMQKISVFTREMEKISSLISFETGDCSNFVKLYKSIDVLIQNVPSSDIPDVQQALAYHSQTLCLLQLSVKDTLLRETREQFELDLRKSLNNFTKPGTEGSVVLRFNLGATASMYGIECAGAEAILEYGLNVQCQDDLRIRDTRTLTATAQIKIGNKIIGGSLGVSGAYGCGYVFDNLDEFIKKHSNDVVSWLLHKRVSTIKGVFAFKKSYSVHKEFVACREDLEKRLMMQSVIHSPVSVVSSERPKYLTQRTKSIEGHGGVDVMHVVAGNVAARHERFTFFRYHDLYEHLQGNPDDTPKHKNHIIIPSFLQDLLLKSL